MPFPNTNTTKLQQRHPITTRNTECQGQGHRLTVQVHRTKIPCPCTSHGWCTGTNWPCCHQYIKVRHSSVYTNPMVKVMAPGSKVTGPKFYANTHLPHAGSPHVQITHIGINNLDTAAFGQIPRSRSWLQGQRSQDQNSMP